MNKPTYTAIRTHSPTKPILIFVSSRRQTRLTAFDLVAFVAAEDCPKQWLHTSETEVYMYCVCVCGGEGRVRGVGRYGVWLITCCITLLVFILSRWMFFFKVFKTRI